MIPSRTIRNRFTILACFLPLLGAAIPGPAAGAEATTHWAFLPVQKPALPAPAGFQGPGTPVDAFILARLQELNGTPAIRTSPSAGTRC